MMAMYNVTSYTDNIDEHWHWIEPELMRCQAYHIDPLDMITIKEDIRSRRGMIIVISEGTEVLTVCYVEFYQASLHVRLCSGVDLDKWASVLDKALEQLAQVMGVKHITQLGRVGWARQMKQHGWKHQLSQYVRAV
jgi:hypothetical protein